MISTTAIDQFGKLGRLLLIGGLFLWVTAGTMEAQVTASITGTVKDMSGAVLPGATVTAKHLETGLTRAAETDASGSYSMPSLPIGQYEVSAEKMGFKQEVRRGISLVVAQQAVVDLTLEVGNVEQQVTVTAEAPIVNTTLSSTSGLINEQEVKDLPLNGRSFDQLLTLNVGTVNNTSNLGNTGTWTAFSVAGHRTETNRFLMNGVDYLGDNNSGQFLSPAGASGELLGVEAVREYNVLEHTYGAEYGKRAGGQITIVTTSGTNQLHGDMFEYLRNSDLDARNFFDTSIGAPPFKRNQFGAALGGPLKKDTAFLFGNYEGFRQRLAVSSASIVPDAPARVGMLPCNIISPAPNPCPASGYAQVPNLKAGMLPYANSFWPAPNGPELFVNGLPTGSAFAYGNPAQAIREDFGLLRFDYTISGKDSFSSNFTVDDGDKGQPYQNPVFIGLSDQRAYLLSLHETHIFSPTVLNVGTFGFSRAWGTQEFAPAVPIPSSLVFLTGGNPGAIIIGGGGNTNTAASIVQANGNNFNYNRRNHFTWADDLHFVKGSHSFSAGLWIQRVQQNAFGAAQYSAGTVSYPTLQAFLQDLPTQFIAQPLNFPLYFRSTEAAWYVQDEMKLKPNLTLRLGLRDEMTTGWNEAHGNCSNYVFDQNGIIETNPLIGPSCLTQNNAVALWQPRVGLAWDPTGSGKWAVRAGFGIHNDLQDNLAHRINANPPFAARETITAVPLLSIVPIPYGSAAPPSCQVVGQTGCSQFSPGGLDPIMHTPTIQQWSITVERGIGNDLVLQVGYVGGESYHLSTYEDRNAPQPQICNNPLGCVSGGIRAANQTAIAPQGTTYLPSTPPVTINGVSIVERPNPLVGATQGWFYEGNSNYQALNVSLTKRASHGLTFKANYTFAKVLDLNSAIITNSAINEPSTVLSPYLLNLNRGLASYDLQHQFNLNFSYALPFGRGQRFGGGASGLVDKLIGGWQWNGIVNTQSGFPFTPQVASNISGSGDTMNPDVPNRNPAFSGPVVLGTDGFKKTGHYYDAHAFSLPLAGTFGNVGRGSFTGPALTTFDTSLFKKFSINEKWNVQFRAEAFNIFNSANFGVPNAAVFQGTSLSGSAGVITQTATTSRQIQFALKLLF